MRETVKWLLVPMAWIAVAAIALALILTWVDGRRGAHEMLAESGPQLESELYALTGELTSSVREIGDNIRRLDNEGLTEAQRLHEEELTPLMAQWDSRYLYFRNRAAAIYGAGVADTISAEEDRNYDLSNCNILIDRRVGYTAGQCERDREREASAARRVVRAGETGDAPEGFNIPQAFSGNLYAVNHLFVRYFQCMGRQPLVDPSPEETERCGDMDFLRAMIAARSDIMGLKRTAIADAIRETQS